MLDVLIMLVDDEKPFVDTMVKRLAKRELSVISAYSGSEALEHLAHNKHLDVVILDVKMPGLDGIETLGKIKKVYPLVEVIMLTGHATVGTAIEGMKLGAFDYLMKPCDIEHLMAQVREAVQKKRRQEDKIKEAMIKKALAQPS